MSNCEERSDELEIVATYYILTLRSFVRRYMGEIVATLEPVAGVDFAEYMNTLVER